MALHLIKMAVGIQSIEEFQARQQKYCQQAGLKPGADLLIHTTRNFPKRRDEILKGGSLFWVFQKRIQARQKIIDLKELVDNEGGRRCGFILETKLIPVEKFPRKAFQGWRYLTGEDAPADIKGDHDAIEKMPPAMRQDLLELCLI